jgi:hypothetical protein
MGPLVASLFLWNEPSIQRRKLDVAPSTLSKGQKWLGLYGLSSDYG